MLELPFTVNLHVIVFIARRQPQRAIALAKREWPHEIPVALRPIPLHLNNGVHDVMLRETDPLLEALEQRPDGGVSLMTSDVGALPDAILDEQRRNLVGIVIVVADGAVTRLQLLDRFGVLAQRDALFEFRYIHDDSLQDLDEIGLPLVTADLRFRSCLPFQLVCAGAV